MSGGCSGIGLYSNDVEAEPQQDGGVVIPPQTDTIGATEASSPITFEVLNAQETSDAQETPPDTEICKASCDVGDNDVSSNDVEDDTQGKVCVGEQPPTAVYNVGDKVEAGNGIIVEVIDKFETADLPIACFDFHLGDQKLNNNIVCVQNFKSTFISECWTDEFTDYGVRIPYRFAGIDDLRLNVFSTTPGDVNTSLDLFNECIEAGKSDDMCTRYVAFNKIEGEDELVSGANHLFFPAGIPELGEYHSAQLDACTKLADEILLGGQPLATDGYSLRLFMENGKKLIGGHVLGRAIGSNYQMGYFIDEKNVGSFFKTISEYPDINDGLCHDGVILHERSHNTWGARKESYFPVDLQEGAARFMELAYPVRPEPIVYFDGVFHEGDTFVFEHESLESGPVKHVIQSISQDKVELAFIDEWGDPLMWSDVKPGTLDHLQFGGDFQLVTDEPTDDGDGLSVRLRVVRDQPIERPINFGLECHEDTYSLAFGLWLGGQFYDSMVSMAADEGDNIPYVLLDGSADLSPQLYSTGACFFRGIEEAFNAAGADFSTFFPVLTASIHEYEALPLKDQFENEYCILDEMQKIADAAGAGGSFDVKGYAEKFGYDDVKPWCTNLQVYAGENDQFGDPL